jgi:hypothetical protein
MPAFSRGMLEATGGRFWVISPGDDSDEDAPSTPAGHATPSPTEFCRTPSEESYTLLPSALSAIVRREQKRQRQREAAMLL